MLEAFKSKNASASRLITVVGPGTAVNGRLTSTGSIRVEGRVSGLLQSEAEVMVLPSGQVLADIVAQKIVISGEVEGDVTASERLEITRGARVVGNISAPRIHIDEAVVFEGRCTMHAPDYSPASQRPPVRDKAVPPQLRRAKGKGKSKGNRPEEPVDKADEISPGGFYTRDPNRQFPLEQGSEDLLPMEDIDLLHGASDAEDTGEASAQSSEDAKASNAIRPPQQGQFDVGDTDDDAANATDRKPE